MPVNESPEEKVFLVIRTTKGELGKLRKHLHSQPWYKYSDVPISNGRDYFGNDTSDLFKSLLKHWHRWKAAADRLRGK